MIQDSVFHSEWLVGEASSDDEDGCGRMQVPGEIKAESTPSFGQCYR